MGRSCFRLRLLLVVYAPRPDRPLSPCDQMGTGVAARDGYLRACTQRRACNSTALICVNPAKEGPSHGAPQKALIFPGCICRWKPATESVLSSPVDAVAGTGHMVRRHRAEEQSAPTCVGWHCDTSPEAQTAAVVVCF
jgi:hypothetical protein